MTKVDVAAILGRLHSYIETEFIDGDFVTYDIGHTEDAPTFPPTKDLRVLCAQVTTLQEENTLLKAKLQEAKRIINNKYLHGEQ